jgi:tartrate dehydrogenase/decarboxylase/D-malate dehydrogenase
MMLDFLGEEEAARTIESAVVGVLAERRDLTPDLGGTGTTAGVANAVVARVMTKA